MSIGREFFSVHTFTYAFKGKISIDQVSIYAPRPVLRGLIFPARPCSFHLLHTIFVSRNSFAIPKI
jgi:hypothetical protein